MADAAADPVLAEMHQRRALLLEQQRQQQLQQQQLRQQQAQQQQRSPAKPKAKPQPVRQLSEAEMRIELSDALHKLKKEESELESKRHKLRTAVRRKAEHLKKVTKLLNDVKSQPAVSVHRKESLQRQVSQVSQARDKSKQAKDKKEKKAPKPLSYDEEKELEQWKDDSERCCLFIELCVSQLSLFVLS